MALLYSSKAMYLLTKSDMLLSGQCEAQRTGPERRSAPTTVMRDVERQTASGERRREGFSVEAEPDKRERPTENVKRQAFVVA